MKKIFLVPIAALLLMAGCTADEQPDARDLVPIYLTATVSEPGNGTRAGADVQSAQFGASETFYAYFPTGVRVGETTSASGTSYTTDGNGATTAATTPYFTAGTTSATVHAYYPYVTGKQVTAATTSFSVETDQSSADGYKKSDLMYATATVQKSNPVGALTFTHRMAKIIVNATLGGGIGNITAVKIVGGQPTVALSGTDCTVGDVSGTAFSPESPLTVFSGTHTEGTLSCAALIPPQTVTGSFLVITTDQGDITYSLDSKAFASGQSYTFNVTVIRAAVGTPTIITGWAANGIAIVRRGLEAIDLGLPSGTKWASMNVGATSETDYGMFFMWGDVAGHPNVENDGYYFGWTNYKWWSEGDGEGTKLSKYVPTEKASSWGGEGDPDNKLVLDPADDAATANWGSPWRMPTKGEWEELISNTTQAWTTNYMGAGITGCIVTAANGQTLFLPAAGYRYSTYRTSKNYSCKYWSSSLNTDSPRYAWHIRGSRNQQMNQFYEVEYRLNFDLNKDDSPRSEGYTVRPVQGN